MGVPSLVLGYHGCDESVGEKVLRGEQVIASSKNAHDWLGEGAYFWENNPARALQWAEFIKAHPRWFEARIQKPFVIGAIIALGQCLDLTEAESLGIVRNGFKEMAATLSETNFPLPSNEKGSSKDDDLVKRKRDCAVINFVHEARAARSLPTFDTVRAVFCEGEPLYEGARIMARTHIQIAVRNPASIRGYFRPNSGSWR
ncbi:MAG: hypothetical protein JWM32_180 [Verrucomicrobia bacterium]|nr:hypothetical protein [Verrucomicrobiota bacterium]